MQDDAGDYPANTDDGDYTGNMVEGEKAEMDVLAHIAG